MNHKAILGISLGAVFAIGMISMGMANFAIANESPDFMTFNATSDGSVLKDHAAGNNPAKNPAHWELIANVTGNMTQISADYNATGVPFGAIGIGILQNQTEFVYAVTIHNDTDSSAAAFEPHGHKIPILSINETCENGLELDLENAVEIGEAKLEVINGLGGANYTVVEFDDIPFGEHLEGEDNVCDAYTEDGSTIYAFYVGIDEDENVCAYLTDTDGVPIDQDNGPNQGNSNGKNPNKPNRLGGFEDEIDPNDDAADYYQCSS